MQSVIDPQANNSAVHETWNLTLIHTEAKHVVEMGAWMRNIGHEMRVIIKLHLQLIICIKWWANDDKIMLRNRTKVDDLPRDHGGYRRWNRLVGLSLQTLQIYIKDEMPVAIRPWIPKIIPLHDTVSFSVIGKMAATNQLQKVRLAFLPQRSKLYNLGAILLQIRTSPYRKRAALETLPPSPYSVLTTLF